MMTWWQGLEEEPAVEPEPIEEVRGEMLQCASTCASKMCVDYANLRLFLITQVSMNVDLPSNRELLLKRISTYLAPFEGFMVSFQGQQRWYMAWHFYWSIRIIYFCPKYVSAKNACCSRVDPHLSFCQMSKLFQNLKPMFFSLCICSGSKNMTPFRLRCFRITCCLHCLIFQVHGAGGQDEAKFPRSKLPGWSCRVVRCEPLQRNNKQTNMILRFYMCQGLNSHCFPMVGMVINPIVGVLLKVGWPSPI